MRQKNHPADDLSRLDRFSKRMSEMTGERGGFSGKERTRRLLES
jgi:hypothetical protein